MRTSRASSVTKKWLLFSQLCLLKDLVIRCVRQFIRRAKAMLLSQNVVVEPAEISVVVDVKSSQQDLSSFQIAQVRIRDSVCIEIPVPEETPLLGSVRVRVGFNAISLLLIVLDSILDQDLTFMVGIQFVFS